MKRNWRNNIVLGGIFLLMIFSACGNRDAHADHAETYICPMHPTVVAGKPGICPVCGMDLVRQVRPGDEVAITGDLADILKSPNEIVVSTVRTIKAAYKSVPVRIRAQGIVTYDPRTIHSISARVGGRLEKVFLKYAFQPVIKGQKVAEIYSPELITAQRELLYLLETDSQNAQLILLAKNKILLMGASQAQLTALIQRKEAINTFAIYSPYGGYLMMEGTPLPTVPSPTTTSEVGTDPMGPSSRASQQFPIGENSSLLREGSYVSTGQTLFRTIDRSSLRVEIDLPATQATWIKKGSPILLDFANGEEVNAAVDLIQPFFNASEAFVKLVMYVTHEEGLHVGHLVNASIDIQSAASLWLPTEAVVDLGLNRVVFAKEGSVFKPRKITTGTKAAGWVEIMEGVVSTDEIAANAQYLVDSESFIKEN